MIVFENCEKKAFDGCDGMITFLPIARASAVAVHNTSEVDGLTKTR